MCGMSSHGEEQVASGLLKEMQDRGEGEAKESTSKAGEAQSEKTARQHTQKGMPGKWSLCQADTKAPPL